MKFERAIGDLLREQKATLSVAESCTGGLVSDRITNVSGSSDYFQGGIVSYSIEVKARHLNIPLRFIKQYGVVSAQVARKMAEGIRKAFHTTFGLSITGVAGPSGGTTKTPVGTIFIGFSKGEKTLAIEEHFKGSRKKIKVQAAEKSLRFLYENLFRSMKDLKSGMRISDFIKELSLSKESTLLLVRKAPRGISNQKNRLGIFPASFNPPTMAHLALIREARRTGDLDEILVLLDIAAMDKRPAGSKFGDRLQMLKMVFRRDPTISIGLSNRGLFAEKLTPLRALYPSPIQFSFIGGFDTILRVIDKKYYGNRKKSLDELFKQSRFLVANRNQYEETAFEILFRKTENKKYRIRITFFRLPEKFSSLSSSLVRKRIREGQTVNDLIPTSILRFIKKTGLYTKTISRSE